LQDGLKIDPTQSRQAMLLARLQVEQGNVSAGLATLQRSLPAGADRADYQGFMAALLQREGRNREAIEHYQRALRKAPNSGAWLTGLGISLQSENRLAEARDAFERARASNSLDPELKTFVDQQLQH
jgi:MSHA biogenesis protein MshN